MSHITKLQVKVKDLACLKAAAAVLGMEMKQKGTFKAYENAHCDYALSVKDNKQAYEVGVARNAQSKGEYNLLLDFYQGGYGLESVIGRNGNKLKQGYAVQVAKKQLNALVPEGFDLLTQQKKDGSIELLARRY